MTAEEALAIIKDSYRHAAVLDPECEPDVDLRIDTSVSEWRDACDLLGWRKLGRALNDWFGTQFTDDQWWAVLEPSSQRTLRGVCDLIASQALKPKVAPFRIGGAPCLSAGAFLSIRTALAQHGVPTAGVTPSTPIGPLARVHVGEFVTALGILSPGALPVPEIEETVAQAWSLRTLGAGLLVAILAALVGIKSLAGVAVVVALLGLIGRLIALRNPPRAVRFGSLETFRDLTRAVVALESRPDHS